jgi:DnaJ-class molecular chaperone|eukprot:SAG25_NODE_993_length_4385_cov_513.820345_5_plen_80_part_00
MDYYSVLGLQPDADQATVQGSYRNLALKWHPLRSKDPNAENNFHEVSEAYEVLSNCMQNLATGLPSSGKLMSGCRVNCT